MKPFRISAVVCRLLTYGALLFAPLAGFAAPVPQVTASAAHDFGTVAIGQTATTSVTFTFPASFTVGSVSVVTQGATGKDFQATSPATSGTLCAAQVYTASQTCTVDVTFSPLVGGRRMGAVVLRNTSSQILATAYLSGLGTGAQLAVVAPAVSTFVGTGTYSTVNPSGSTGTAAGFVQPNTLAFDGAGNLYMADVFTSMIYKITPAGLVSTVLGSYQATCGTNYTCGYPRTNSTTLASSSSVYRPQSLLVDGAGQLWFIDNSVGALATVDLASGYVTSQVPGNGNAAGAPTTTGNIHSLGISSLGSLASLASDGLGNIYVSAFFNGTQTTLYSMILKLDAAGNISVFAGNTTPSYNHSAPADGTVATSAVIGGPSGIGFDGAGNAYFYDQIFDQVFKIDTSGKIHPFAGSGVNTSDNTSGLPYWQSGSVSTTANTAVNFAKDVGYLAVDLNGNVFVPSSPINYTDSNPSSRVFVFTPGGMAYVLAGSGALGAISDVPSATQLAIASAVVVNDTGDVYISDRYIRQSSDTPAVYVGATVRKWTAGTSSAALSFADTATGQTSSDSPKSITFTNIGNAVLSLSTPITGKNPSISAGFTVDNTSTCPSPSTTPSGTLEVGASCTYAFDFIPAGAGSNSGSLVLTGNLTSPSIALSGTGLAPAVNHFAFTKAPPSSNTVNVGFSAEVTAYSDAGNTVATGYSGPVKVTSSDSKAFLSPVTLINGVASFNVVLRTSGPQTITFADASNTPSITSGNITVIPGAPSGVTAAVGTPQSAFINKDFATPLTVQVVDSYSNPISGLQIGFNSPSTGASATLSPGSCTTGSNGMCSVNATANGTAGDYNVSAFLNSSFAQFSLTNQLPPSFQVTVSSDNTTGVAANCRNHSLDPLIDTSCSLRDALTAANALHDSDVTILFFPAVFNSTKTITLAHGELPINGSGNNVTITGPGQGLLTVSGNNDSGIFTQTDGQSLTITDMTITSGHTDDSGANVHGGSGVLTLRHVTVSNGYAPFAGGIYAAQGLVISNSTISGNSSTGQAGGIYSQSNLTMSDSTVTANNAVGTGGGVLTNGSGNSYTFTNTVFKDNFANIGAAIATDGSSYQPLNISASTFSNNTATTRGAALNISQASASIVNSTFTGNHSDGGIIYLTHAGSADVQNATIYANIGSAFTNETGTLPTGSNNIIQSNTGGNCDTCSMSGSYTGTSEAVDMGILVNNGGPTQTIMPAVGSPAICGGIDNGVTTDQRGLTRGAVYGDTTCIDAGAVQTHFSVYFARQPADVLANAVMSPGPIAQLAEGEGNAFGTIPFSFTLNGSGALGGTVTGNTSGLGRVNFSDLTVSAGGAADTLTTAMQITASSNSSPVYVSVTSDPFKVTLLVDHFVLSGIPDSIAAGDSFTITATAYSDAGGLQVATGYNGPVTFTSTDIRFDANNSLTLNPVNGVASIGVSLGTVGTQTITVADSSGSPSKTSANIVVTAGEATRVEGLSGNNQSTAIGAVFTAPLLVKASDNYGNPVPGVSVLFSAPGSGASATLSAPAVTSADGTTSVTATANATASATPYLVTAALVQKQAVSGIHANQKVPSSSFSLTNTQASTTLAVTQTATVRTYGQPVTVNAAISPASVLTSLPTGSVTFFDASTPLTPNSTVTAAAAASYTVAAPAVGSHTFSAQYLGDANFRSSPLKAASAAVVVSKASSTLSGPTGTQAVPPSSSYNVVVNLAGQFSGSGIAPPTGQIGFSIGDGLNVSSAVNIVSGSATYAFPVNSATLGHVYTVTVTYAGDANYNAATQTTVSVQVGQATPTISWTQPSAIVYGTTLAGLLNASALNNATSVPGTYSYTANATGGSPSAVSGTTVLSGGAYTLHVTFTPTDSTTYTTATGSVPLTVSPAAVSITNTPSPITQSYGATVNGTVSVAGIQGGATPTGSLSYSIDSSLPVAGTLTASGAAFSLPILSGGAHSIQFSYAGDANYAAKQSTVNFSVSRIGSTLSGATGTQVVPPASSYNVVVNLAGALAGQGIALPTGQVGFSIGDGLNVSSASNIVGGSATYAFPVNSATIGHTYAVTVTYAGDANFNAATQITVSVQVGQITPTISWTQPSAIVYGATLTGVLNASALNNATSVPGTFAYTATPSGGSASAVTGVSVLGAGSYTLNTTFTPTDTQTYKSASGSVTLTVAKIAPAVVLTSSINPLLLQNATLLRATVSSAASTPTGTVTFLDGVTSLGSATLTAGAATLSVSTLTVGSHTITAVYSGDANFNTLTSAAVTQTVQDFNLSISAAGGSSSVTSVTALPGGVAVYTLTISPTGTLTFPSAVTLSVSGLPAGATYTLLPATIAAGAGSTTVTLTIQVPSQTSAVQPHDSFGKGLAPIALGLLLLPFSRPMRRSAKQWSRLTLLLLLLGGAAAMSGLTGCGAGTGFFGQAPQSYTITITGTSGALSHSTNVTLTVQ